MYHNTFNLSMMHRNKTINAKSAVVLIASCFIIYTLYYNFHEYNFYRIDYMDIFLGVRNRTPIYSYNGSEDFLINTTGCHIPNYGKTMVFHESKILHKNCGERAIFITRNEDTKKLEFQIDFETLNKYSKNESVNCTFRFGRRSAVDNILSYTQWKPFENGTNITHLTEVITVMCKANIRNKKNSVTEATVYEDAYVVLKKLKWKNEKPDSNEKRWNVLIVGLDTMSRARFLSSMPGTAQYLKKHGWLDYKGYHKVDYNTFPNVMAFLTGNKLDTIYKRCTLGLYTCNDLFLWQKFRQAGYMTAYGEDNLSLPDTFSPQRYKGFRYSPTHHYMRPLFLTGETKAGNLICAHHMPSALHILNYAYDFTNAYKTKKFFGIFWINSYSHNLDYNPTLFDNETTEFFEQLNENEVLNNTIVIFTSDHGIRFGQMRVPVESYYEERLPMLFVWIPHQFRRLHEEKYYNSQLNQNRLVTPYDIHVTLENILNNFNTSADVKSEACPHCTSLFVEKSMYRTCDDAGISEKWCCCHEMTKVDARDTDAKESVQAAVKHLQDKAKSIKTKNSKPCRPTHLKKVIRTHSYLGSGNKTHYVIAWVMAPGGMSYEATVVKEDNGYTVLQPTHAIESYEKNNHGHCVKNSNDHEFCVC